MMIQCTVYCKRSEKSFCCASCAKMYECDAVCEIVKKGISTKNILAFCGQASHYYNIVDQFKIALEYADDKGDE